jgi:fatty acid desaturase
MNVSEYLPKDELARLMLRSNALGWWAFMVNWGLIAGAFVLAIILPNPLTIIGATFIIAGRQLGLGILVHDCAHHALFKDRRANEIAGQWLAGPPINLNFAEYRKYHLAHHRHTGTSKDPDLVFVAKYPVSGKSLRRKLIRDITGQTGLRDLVRTLSDFVAFKQLPWVSFHMVLFAVLALCRAPWAYPLWWVAQIFIFPVLVRLRQVGEHGVVLDRGDSDPRRNTSTTIVRWWERLLVAPNNVNYHIEHHVAAGVPSYRLARMHKMLMLNGFYNGSDALSFGSIDVLRRATRRAA